MALFEGSGINQEQLDEIKARYGIGGRASGPSRFPIVLIRPSHYDVEGYVLQWYRPAMASGSLAAMRGLVEDCTRRKVLGEQVQVEIRAMEEDHTRIRTQQLARALKDGQGLVILVGVQSIEFPRAMDLALPLRVAGVQVCMGGIHVSSGISKQGGATAELQEAMNLGISLFAGEAEEGRLDQVLRDAWRGELKPLYNYVDDPPLIEGAPAPLPAAEAIRETIAKYASFDAGRGSPFERSSCTVIDVDRRKPRQRTVDEVERIVREHLGQGVGRFFITDDCFSGNPDWEAVFGRLIEMREREGLNIRLAVQVDAQCHRLPGFIEKAARAGVQRVFVGLESMDPQSLLREKKMLQAWKRAGVIVFAGYVIGSPGETRESVLGDIRIIQKKLAVDLLEPQCLTAPGPEDDPEPAATQDAAMTAEERAQLDREAWKEFYTLEHMETVLRRAAATGVPLESMMRLLLWFHYWIVYEKIDPMQGGYLRRRYRTDRRTTMAKVGWLRFWMGYGSELVFKHWQMARLFLRFRRFVGGLKRACGANAYTDSALTPDAETDPGTVETWAQTGLAG